MTGCCVVIGAVPRTLLMDIFILQQKFIQCKGFCAKLLFIFHLLFGQNITVCSCITNNAGFEIEISNKWLKAI